MSRAHRPAPVSPSARRLRASLGVVALLVLAGACPAAGDAPKGGAAKAGDAKAGDAKIADAKIADAKTADAKSGDTKPAEPLGRVLDGPMPIASLLGKPPGEVQPLLSEPLGKGMVRKSCVRFLPERTWFGCEFATQRYGDRSGAYSAIAVEYSDGLSTAVAFEGPKNATGPFDARAALAYVGLELPGEPKVENPDADAVVYAWFNAAARLLIDGRQYRVVVSSVGADWARTKIEIILNDPLNEAERARVIERPTADAN